MSATYGETFFSIDVETAGPIPGEYSMLSIGACLVFDPAQRFSCQLKPTSDRYIAEALDVSGLSLQELTKFGRDPKEAMLDFAEWISRAAGDSTPVFVGLNAPFDWSFVNYYFHCFTGDNPFGFTALDIKALWMGVAGGNWADTRSSRIADELRPEHSGDHNALHDAIYQAELFRLALKRRDAGRSGSQRSPSALEANVAAPSTAAFSDRN